MRQTFSKYLKGTCGESLIIKLVFFTKTNENRENAIKWES